MSNKPYQGFLSTLGREIDVKNVNEALRELNFPKMNIEVAFHWAYVAARAVITELDLGQDKLQKDNGNMNFPRWQRRLENIIASLRSSIEVITNYIINPAGASTKL